MGKRKLILDCDPGHDDAVAFIMAAKAPELELLGVTTVRGNQTLEKTTKNALNICQCLGFMDMPVCMGSAVPIVNVKAEVAAYIHGESGLDGPVFEPLKKEADKRSAIEFIIEQVKKYPKEVTLVVTGPMTNIALAMRVAPEIVPMIKEIIFMGGAWTYGNSTPAAEFNIWVDPEAADIVFRSGVPLVMMGLDLTRQVLCYPEIVERMEKIKNPASKLFADLMHYFCMTQKKSFGWEGGPLHDPTTIAYMLDPDCIETVDMYGEVDISHGISYGRTNLDRFGRLGGDLNVKVSVKADVDRFWDLVEKCLHYYD